MQSSAPVESDLCKYFTSIKFIKDFKEAANTFKNYAIEAGRRIYYTRCERRVEAAQRKERPELKDGWDVLDLVNKFKLPPLDDIMERVDGTTLTIEEFQEKYERPRIPCVITGLTKDWKAHENWTIKKLTRKYGNVPFKCGAQRNGHPVMLKFKYYAEYMRENDDDSPLYIFDDSFGERKHTKELLNDYEVPEIFRDNLFEILGTHEKRPQYRWIVIGPARSGTNIHVDPLGTSAWNALIHGHKRWVLIHPDTPSELVKIPKSQRGVHPKEAITWFSTLYKRICDGDWPIKKYPVFECRQNPGETLFVPCGWWHVVINEDDTVAVTQNFCSPVNLVHVYPTIQEQRPGLTRVFLEKLNEKRRELLETVYKSLLDPKPILEDYSSQSEEGEKSEETCSTTSTLDSTADLTDFSESEAEKKRPNEELHSDENSSSNEDVEVMSEEREDSETDSEESRLSVESRSLSESDSEDEEYVDSDSSYNEGMGNFSRPRMPICTPPDGVKHRPVASRVDLTASLGESEA